MEHRTISKLCNDWIGHMRRCDQSAKRDAEEIRLTHDQAMRLCFELSRELYGSLSEHSSGPFVGSTQDRAMAAYVAGRPWDLLAGSHLFARLVPYEPRVYPAIQSSNLLVGMPSQPSYDFPNGTSNPIDLHKRIQNLVYAP